MLCFQNFNGLWHELVLMHNGTYSIHNEMNVCTHFILEYKFILKVNLALAAILFKKGRNSVTFFPLLFTLLNLFTSKLCVGKVILGHEMPANKRCHATKPYGKYGYTL